MDEAKFKEMVERRNANKLRSFNRHKCNMQDTRQYKINASLRELRVAGTSHINCFRFNPGNNKDGDLHEDKKYQIYKQLIKEGHEVITEAIFKESGLRCDILCLDEQVIYEILNTESEEECDDKVKNYPELFEIVKIKVDSGVRRDVVNPVSPSDSVAKPNGISVPSLEI
jgi:hypothetical protein